MKYRVRWIKDEEGAMSVLAAFGIIFILIVASLACDYGLCVYFKNNLQTAVDAAARAASIDLVNEDIPESQRIALCEEDAEYFLAANGFERDKLSKCIIDADLDTGVYIEAEFEADMVFAKIFGHDKLIISASGGAVTEYTYNRAKKVTVDVSFVLDVSKSMIYLNNVVEYDNKLIPMIDATNEAIDIILSENADNRVSVVVYSGANESAKLIELTNNPSAVTSATISGTSYTFQSPTDTIPNVYLGYKLSTSGGRASDITAVLAGESTALKTGSGTFLQKGIYMGSSGLVSSSDDGKERVPTVFIMTDGAANMYNTNYSSAISSASAGMGSNANCGYYTILTANYWKNKLTEYYTSRNGVETNARFYTLGFDLEESGNDAEFAAGLLNPDSLETATSSTAIQLRNMLQGTANPYRNDYNYADEYYEANGSTELKEILKQFANEAVLPTKTYVTRLYK